MRIAARSALALLAAFSLAAQSLPTRAAPAAPAGVAMLDSQAAAHAATVAAAKQAQADLAVLRKAGENGPDQSYRDALLRYAQQYYAVNDALKKEAAANPEAAAATAASDAAYKTYQMLRAAPDTTPRAMAIADAARQSTADAQGKASDAAMARARARLAAEDIALPDPFGPALYAKGQTGPLVEVPNPVGVHGFVFTPFAYAPWQVELQWADLDDAKPPMAATDLHACGGALIAPDWVLTAAHCVWDRDTGKVRPVTQLRARAGANSLSAPMPASRIDRIVLPAGAMTYIPSTAFAPAQNDIALLHLATPLGAGPKAKAALIAYAPKTLPPIGDKRELTVSGWGATEAQTFGEQTAPAAQHGILRMSPDLRFAPLQLIDNAGCYERITQGIQDVFPDAKVGPLTASSICAGSSMTGTCVGDSGGPLVLHTVQATRPEMGDNIAPHLQDGPIRGDHPLLVGIVSWGVGCEDFTVFTRVSSYADWIAATLAPRHARRH